MQKFLTIKINSAASLHIRVIQILFIGIFLSTMSFSSKADGFLSLLPDIPLPPGFHEISESQVEFDSPTGRILQSTASGQGSFDDVSIFYSETLPQLGWQKENNASFIRESERLQINNSTNEATNENINSKITILFEISPVNP